MIGDFWGIICQSLSMSGMHPDLGDYLAADVDCRLGNLVNQRRIDDHEKKEMTTLLSCMCNELLSNDHEVLEYQSGQGPIDPISPWSEIIAELS